MSKHRNACGIVVLMTLVAWAAPLSADVKTQEKSLMKFGGALGKMVSMFGGKGMREGIVSTIAVKDDRKARVTDKTEQIIDLKEEKIYDINLEDKSYTVTTFAEMRKKMEDAREAAKKRQQERAGKDEDKSDKRAKPDEQQPQYDVDFDLKDTGEKKTIAGYDTHEVIMTITVREKGKTLDESGGVVLTADMWMAPDIPEMKEISDFDRRYFQQLYGPMMSTQEMQQFAAAVAAHPGLKDAMARFNKEKVDMKGTPISTVVTFDAVASKQQVEESAKEQKQSDDDKPSSPSGLGGMLARKFAKKKAEEDKDSKDGKDAGPKNRANIMTMNNDVLKIEKSATTEDVAVPAGFKQKS